MVWGYLVVGTNTLLTFTTHYLSLYFSKICANQLHPCYLFANGCRFLAHAGSTDFVCHFTSNWGYTLTILR